ncbi:hypothetical protein JTE90_005143 [Oedothorax gibbosus]|uniref:Uncharacterized protein n=1 Tax=Oedothorax gibbosus TaxID=931172 RepID=A0AAV6ULJ7_9ARAC|nr:hypothetical protein JTE90_005143 [Oedothorax gibbosus]
MKRFRTGKLGRLLTTTRTSTTSSTPAWQIILYMLAAGVVYFIYRTLLRMCCKVENGEPEKNSEVVTEETVPMSAVPAADYPKQMILIAFSRRVSEMLCEKENEDPENISGVMSEETVPMSVVAAADYPKQM